MPYKTEKLVMFTLLLMQTLLSVNCGLVAGGSWTKRGSTIDLGPYYEIRGSVGISEDGTRIAVAFRAIRETPVFGKAMVYEWNGSDWTQMGSTFEEDGVNSISNYIALSKSGNVLAITDVTKTLNGNSNVGEVRLYKWDGTIWTQLGNAIEGETGGDNFGGAVSLSRDGFVVAISAKYNDNAGSNAGHVKIFSWDSSSWTQRGNDIEGGASNDNLSHRLSLSDDGTVVATTTIYTNNSAGYCQVYYYTGSVWLQRGSTIHGSASSDYLGLAVSLSGGGDYLAIAAPLHDSSGFTNNGQIKVYYYNGSSWNQRGSFIEGNLSVEQAGYGGVTISDDGEVVIASGNNNHGYAIVYEWSGSNWIQPGTKIYGDDTNYDTSRDTIYGFTESIMANPTATAYVGLAETNYLEAYAYLMPTDKPSSFPSSFPSKFPSNYPSVFPSIPPTNKPSSFPSSFPSKFPSYHPSELPSITPTNEPSSFPSSFPSKFPSYHPSELPSITPTNEPSSFPSSFPSNFPSNHPSVLPSITPTQLPSNEPSSIPSMSPTLEPTQIPSNFPSYYPTTMPSSNPSSLPSKLPSFVPTSIPSYQPSLLPSTSPSPQSSSYPSSYLFLVSSLNPSTISPSTFSSYPNSFNVPTMYPSIQPSTLLSKSPAKSPSPSYIHTNKPSNDGTLWLSDFPTYILTIANSNIPTVFLSRKPTLTVPLSPSMFSSRHPSLYWSNNPSVFDMSHHPSVEHASILSISPSNFPTNVQTSVVPSLSQTYSYLFHSTKPTSISELFSLPPSAYFSANSTNIKADVSFNLIVSGLDLASRSGNQTKLSLFRDQLLSILSSHISSNYLSVSLRSVEVAQSIYDASQSQTVITFRCLGEVKAGVDFEGIVLQSILVVLPEVKKAFIEINNSIFEVALDAYLHTPKPSQEPPSQVPTSFTGAAVITPLIAAAVGAAAASASSASASAVAGSTASLAQSDIDSNKIEKSEEQNSIHATKRPEEKLYHQHENKLCVLGYKNVHSHDSDIIEETNEENISSNKLNTFQNTLNYDAISYKLDGNNCPTALNGHNDVKSSTDLDISEVTVKPLTASAYSTYRSNTNEPISNGDKILEAKCISMDSKASEKSNKVVIGVTSAIKATFSNQKGIESMEENALIHSEDKLIEDTVTNNGLVVLDDHPLISGQDIEIQSFANIQDENVNSSGIKCATRSGIEGQEMCSTEDERGKVQIKKGKANIQNDEDTGSILDKLMISEGALEDGWEDMFDFGRRERKGNKESLRSFRISTYSIIATLKLDNMRNIQGNNPHHLVFT